MYRQPHNTNTVLGTTCKRLTCRLLLEGLQVIREAHTHDTTATVRNSGGNAYKEESAVSVLNGARVPFRRLLLKDLKMVGRVKNTTRESPQAKEPERAHCIATFLHHARAHRHQRREFLLHANMLLFFTNLRIHLNTLNVFHFKNFSIHEKKRKHLLSTAFTSRLTLSVL